MNNSSRAVSILLVDDDEINNFISIKLIKKALITSEIMACLNGKFAIEQLVDIQKKDPDTLPDFILLDINMPIMNDINKARSYPLVKSFISKPLSVEKIKEMFEVENQD